MSGAPARTANLPMETTATKDSAKVKGQDTARVVEAHTTLAWCSQSLRQVAQLEGGSYAAIGGDVRLSIDITALLGSCWSWWDLGKMDSDSSRGHAAEGRGHLLPCEIWVRIQSVCYQHASSRYLELSRHRYIVLTPWLCYAWEGRGLYFCTSSYKYCSLVPATKA